MKKLIIACVVVAGLTVAGRASTANAARFGFHIGGGGVHIGVGHGHRRHRRHRRHGYHGYWHNTGHYDWHSGYYQRHGNHLDYTPGHWDYHNTGHWDFH